MSYLVYKAAEKFQDGFMLGWWFVSIPFDTFVVYQLVGLLK